MGALTPAAGFRGAPGEQGNGVKEQDFGGVAIKRILVCSGARVWGARRLHKDRGTWPRPSARCNPGSSFQDPLSTCAPGPAPGDVTSLRQPGGSRGAWGGLRAAGWLSGDPHGAPHREDGRTQSPDPGPGGGRGGCRGRGRVGLEPQVCRGARPRPQLPTPTPRTASPPGWCSRRPWAPAKSPARPHPSGSPSLPASIPPGSRPSRSPSLSVPISFGPRLPPSPSSPVPQSLCPLQNPTGLQPGPPRSTKAEKPGSTKPAPPAPPPCPPCTPERPVHPGTCGLRMLLPAPGRPGLRRLRVRARPELPGGRGENPLRLARPQPVTSPFRRGGRGAGRVGNCACVPRKAQ